MKKQVQMRWNIVNYR